VKARIERARYEPRGCVATVDFQVTGKSWLRLQWMHGSHERTVEITGFFPCDIAREVLKFETECRRLAFEQSRQLSV
jgi:hypothetical protein